MKNPQIPTPLTRPHKVQSPDHTQEQIRQQAYELYEQRGSEDGHDLDDWLTAEKEVTRRTQSAAA
jgi:DUF2934 family protein